MLAIELADQSSCGVIWLTVPLGESCGMLESERRKALKQFRQIPGVGRSVAWDLYNLGFRSVQELKGQDPVKLYFQHCIQRGMKVDRCMLYVFRCAVYYASNETPDPALLKWWNWKDKSTIPG